jgi:hypothetical protein
MHSSGTNLCLLGWETCQVPVTSPLHVSNFLKGRRMWWRTRRQRQALIIGLALAWRRAVQRAEHAPALLEQTIYLSALARQAPDAKEILQRFFKIERLGYRFANGRAAPTTITPRKLPGELVKEIEQLKDAVAFDPGPPPQAQPDLVASRVQVCSSAGEDLLVALEATGRLDLVPAVRWLLAQQGPITFFFKPSGKLGARDTSVWPIRAIETWPAWLRSQLFGTAIDLNVAFCQFLMAGLTQKHGAAARQLALKYPDLVRLLEDRTAFRAELCREVLHAEPTPESTKLIKRVLMAIANGAPVSPTLLARRSPKSSVAAILAQEAPWLTEAQLLAAGQRLKRLADQFKRARRELCTYLLRERPTKAAQRRLFWRYFEWEREARHKLWLAVGRTGLMLHDGLDGVQVDPARAAAVAAELEEVTGLKISIKDSKRGSATDPLAKRPFQVAEFRDRSDERHASLRLLGRLDARVDELKRDLPLAG